MSEKINTKIFVGYAGQDEIHKLIDEISKESHSFDRYLITYIDFLGVTNKMEKSESYESLQFLRYVLSGIVHRASLISEKNNINDFQIKIFSDNVVIAQKINDNILKDQIISMINLVSLIQFEAFFQFDFPLRGGITIGDLYIDNAVVWGSGLIEAYKIENSLANYPRVIVSQKVLDAFDQCKQDSLNIYALIEKDFDGYWFVEYFTAAPNITLIPQISDNLKHKAQTYAGDNERVKQKLNWIIHYFNSYCMRFKDRDDYDKYTLSYI